MGKQGGHIFWQGSLELQWFPGDGMREGQLPGVESLAGDMTPVRMIEKISDDRMPQMLHVDSNLMGSSCFKAKREKGKIQVRTKGYGRIVGERRFSLLKIYAAFKHRSLPPCNGGVDDAGAGDTAFHNGQIGAQDGLSRQLGQEVFFPSGRDRGLVGGAAQG